ncbi:MAG: transposase [Bifidobacteriaceae bacterium]|nr:transposase [Bifidobacteriaceae bacterium]
MDGTDGRWRIAEKTAPDRVMSTVDPEARHARKTRADRRDGFKGHVAADPETGLITDAALTSAAGPDSSDAKTGAAMAGRDPAVRDGQVGQVLADSAYHSGGMLAALDGAGAEAVVKPRPLPVAVKGGFTVDDFGVDREAGEATCPAGRTAKLSPKGRASFARHCVGCPLRGHRARAKQGRVVALGADQLRHREHRAAARAEGFAEDYRR